MEELRREQFMYDTCGYLVLKVGRRPTPGCTRP
jgi:hypothetical protein